MILKCLCIIFSLHNPPDWEAVTPGGGGVFTSAEIHPADSDIIYAASDVAGMIRSDDHGESWTSIAKGLGSAYVQSFAFDPDNVNGIYAAASDGVYYSSQRGENWKKLGALGRASGEGISDGLLSDIHVVSDGTEKVIYAGTGKWHDDINGTGRLWVSRDDGNTWNSYSIGMSDTSAATHSVVSRNPKPGEVWVSTGDGVYRSTDYGQTWEDKTDNLPHRNARKMQCAPDHTHELAVVLQAEGTNSSGVYYRNPDTNEWENRTGNLPLTNDTRNIEYWLLAAGETSFPDTMIVGSNLRGTNDGYYKTTDGGLSWNNISDGAISPIGWFPSAVRGWLLHYDSAGSGDIITGGDGRLLLNKPGTSLFADITTVKISDEASKYGNFTGAPNSAYNVTANRWSGPGESDNMVIQMIAVDPFNHDNLFISCADHVVFRSNDRGASWQKINFKINGAWVGGSFGVVFHPDIKDKLYALVAKGYGATLGEGAIVTSNDGGNTWSLLAGTDYALGGLPGKEPHYLAFGPKDTSGNRKLFAALYQGGIYESINNGANWTRIGMDGMPIRKFAVNPSNENILIVGVAGGPNGGMWRLVNEGGTWNQYHKKTDLSCVNIQASNYQTYFASTLDGLYRTVDQGITWQKVTFPETSSSEKVWGLHCSGAKIYASQYGDNPNIYYSTDRGLTWSTLTRSLDNPRAMWITSTYHDAVRWLYVATQGSGTWRLKLNNDE